MKTVRIFNGIHKIEDKDMSLVPLQVREILQQSRKNLIDRLLVNTGIEDYIYHRFQTKANAQKVLQVKNKLIELQHAGIMLERYRSVFQQILEHENSHIDSALFYVEIDTCIQLCLNEMSLEFDPLETYRIDHINTIQNMRQRLIQLILTEAGIKNFVKGEYYQELEDQAKINYLNTELRDYFFSKRTDYAQMLKYIMVNKIDLVDGCKQLFKNEVAEILDQHFDRSRV
ncbi:MAG TPA: hypothetical protein VIN08_15330 [Ohtaekwangia sp.]|uniref:hypothetical protein n=1 Tax=Ohtaekwangia sp. TaxID=2066019 RepID=UPI002F933026